MKEQTTNTKESTTLTKDQGNWLERTVSQHFTVLLTVLALCGGAVAILLPWALNLFDLTGQVDSNLRLHILYVTGGVIAVLGLVETHRKNTVDREKAGVEKENYEKIQAHQASVLEEQQRQFNVTMDKEREKIEADKVKNEQDHIRQVHAERRSRYTTAIEQLSNDKASIRLGGIYTLVGLVDEWLADEKTISNIEERHKEGQVIINNLCAYIRSPFLPAERAVQLDEPYAKDLQNDFEGDKDKFDADKRAFAQEKAALEEERQVRQSIILEIQERLSKNHISPGPWSVFSYDFTSAFFFYPIDFSNSHFKSPLSFHKATFGLEATFDEATFNENVDFSWARFSLEATFDETKFFGVSDFSIVTFENYVDFTWAIFYDVDFLWTVFMGGAEFSLSIFENNADFSKTTFAQDVDFYMATFKCKPEFKFGENIKYAAKFSNKIYQEHDNFQVSPRSPYKIETEEQEHNGVKFVIPKGTELFDPDDPSEQDAPYI